jgi:serine/threonine protein kinase/WD40 repeat protein
MNPRTPFPDERPPRENLDAHPRESTGSNSDDDDRLIELLSAWDLSWRSDGDVPPQPQQFAALPAACSALACLDLLNRAFAQSSGSTPLENPRRIGRYLVDCRLGSGSFGVVYRAFDPELGRFVAVKFLRPFFRANRERQLRFEREVRASALLDHPGIVPVYDFELSDASAFMVSACCDGGTLRRWREQQSSPVDPDVAADLIRHLALAVNHAHERGVVHRDLKPANILLSPIDHSESAAEVICPAERDRAGRLPAPDSGWLAARIADFGLAKLNDADDERLTRTGTVMGTSAYMAPEQLLAKHDKVGPGADTYALGAILYELMCGQPPHDGEQRLKSICERGTETIRPVRQVRANVPPGLEAICAKALAFEPSHRYGSARALADDLRRYLDRSPIHARESSRWKRVVSSVRKRAVRLGVAGMVVAAMALSTYRGLGPAGEQAPIDQAPSPVVAALEVTGKVAPATETESQTERTTAEAVAALREEEYLEDMWHASSDILLGHSSQAMRRLMKWLPTSPDQFDPRGPEWSYMWQQTRAPEPAATWQLPGGEPQSACFSPDNRWVAVVDAGGVVTVHDIPAGQVILERQCQAAGLQAVRFSADGGFLAVGGTGGDVTVLETRTWNEARRFHADGSGITTLDFSPDGSRLAVGGEVDGTRIWNWRSGENLTEIDQKVKTARWMPDGQSLTVGLAGSWMRLWTPPGGIGHIDTDARNILEFDISTDGTVAASFIESRKYLMEDHRRHTRKRLAHTIDRMAPHPVAISGNARLAAVGIIDGQIDVRCLGPDSISCFEYLSLTAAEESVSTLALDTHGDWLLSATRTGNVRLWSTRALPIEPRLFCRLEATTCESIAFAADSRHLYCGGNGPIVFRFDLENISVTELSGPAGCHWSNVLCGADGNHLYALEANGRNAMRVPLSGSLADAISLSSSPAVAIALSPDGRTLAIAEGEHATGSATVRLCTTDTGSTLHVITQPFSALERMEFSPDGRWLAVIEAKRPIFLFNLLTEQAEYLEDLGQGRMKMAFCPTQPLLVAHSDSRGLNSWDLEQRTVASIAGDDPAKTHAEEMAFSPDGRLLAIASSRRAVPKHSGVNLMHFASRKTIAFLDACGTPRYRLHFSPDGRYLGMVGGHGHSVNRSSAVVWRLDSSRDDHTR